eukprot:3624645-Rhodomonas_salina.2
MLATQGSSAALCNAPKPNACYDLFQFHLSQRLLVFAFARVFCVCLLRSMLLDCVLACCATDMCSHQTDLCTLRFLHCPPCDFDPGQCLPQLSFDRVAVAVAISIESSCRFDRVN